MLLAKEEGQLPGDGPVTRAVRSRNHTLLLVAAAALAAVVAVLAFAPALSLQALRAGQEHWQAQAHAHPVATGAAFFLLYVAVAAASLPGAAVLTLAGGAVFGLWGGTLLVSFASSAGALLAFLAARYVLRQAVQARVSRWLEVVNRGVESDGPLYLATLRLIPLAPFAAINLVMGLTRIPSRTFYWVSQLAMLPATLIYVNAGAQLPSVTSLHDIVTPRVLLSLLALAILPWAGRAAASTLGRTGARSRSAQRPKRFDRNLVVIGGGAAGLVAAYVAAAARASVTLVEEHKLGGDCLNYGCVPSKALIRSARLAHQMRRAERFGLAPVQPSIELAAVMRRVQDVIRAIEPHDSAERFRGLGVDVVAGRARIVDPWRVEITQADGKRSELTTRAIVIAAGARPVLPEVPGLCDIGCLTSDTLWDAFGKLDALPRRIGVLGGGAIGCELAQAFARLGAAVTVIEAGPRLLAREDDEVSRLVHDALQDNGVTVLVGHSAVRSYLQGTDKVIEVRSGEHDRALAFDAVICAVGRQARLTGYGLEELGISGERTVHTNEYLQTLHPNIYAAGDVAGPYQFTHMAAHQAWYAALNGLFGGLYRLRPDLSAVPSTTFVDPEVARVGLNEQEAKAKGVACEVTQYPLQDLDRAITDSEPAGFVKVLTVPGKDRILGVTVVGSHAAEVLSEFVLAMRHGLGLRKILATIHAYPTFAEANKYAAGEWMRAHQPTVLLALLRKYHQWMRR